MNKDLLKPSEAELEVMKVLWEEGKPERTRDSAKVKRKRHQMGKVNHIHLD